MASQYSRFQRGKHRANTEQVYQRIHRYFQFYAQNLTALMVIVSLCVLVLTSLFRDVSLFYPLDEMAFRSEELAQKRAAIKQKQAFTTAQKALATRYLTQAEHFLDQGLYDAARQSFTQALQHDPDCIAADFGRLKSNVFAQINGAYEPEVIEQRLQFILTENPDDPHANTVLAQIYADVDTSKAEALFRQVSEKNKGIAPADAGLAAIELSHNNNKKAAELFAKAVKISPWNRDYHSNWAEALAELGQFDDALKQYDYVLNLDGDYLLAYIEIARLAMRLQQADVAVQYLQTLLTLLHDETITAMEKNNMIWFWKVDKNKEVNLATLQQKQAYVQLSIILANALQGDAKGRAAAMHSALNQQANPVDDAVLRLIRFDMKTVQSLYP